MGISVKMMAAPHAFLDILAAPQVRDAYLAGRITLILSADLETVLWANGAGARFLGFRAVTEALLEPCGFPALTRRSLRESLKNGAGAPVSVQGVEGARDFLAAEIQLASWGKAVFLRSAAAAGDGVSGLTEGLSDDDAEAALVDGEGRLMAVADGFNAAVLAEKELKPLLAEACRDGAVKKRFLGKDKPYPVGVLRLSAEPPVLLLIAGKSGEEKAPASLPHFVFNPALLPARFVWRSNAAGDFTEISPELSRCVGPEHAGIAGKNFAEFAKARQMDQDGAVRALLQSGNPWSGQTLYWPVEGQQLRLRVKLAALPLYSADKRFLGFRGFGTADKTVNEAGDVMREDDEKSGRALNSEDRQAFFAIAEQLQNGAFPGPSEESGAEPAAAGISAAAREDKERAASAEAAGAAAENDIFAELASSVRAELEKEARRQEARKRREEEAERADGARAALKAQQALPQAKAETEAAPRPQAAEAEAAERIKALEAALSAARYQAEKQNFLLNAISEAVLTVDNTGRVAQGNEAAARLFGCRDSALRGKPLSALFAAADSQKLYREIEQAERDKTGPFLHQGREAEGRAADGTAKRLRLNFGCAEPGKSYFLLLRDMSRFHEIIAALLRKNSEEAELFRRRARYFALISHEIRTPLAALLGMAEFIAAEKAGPLSNEKYSEYLADMLRAGSHIMTLINDILPSGGENAQWPQMHIAPLPLPPLLNEALALMTPQANAANIIMRSGVAADLPPVLADGRAVKQILLNLLANAIHFTREGGQIVISAHRLPEREGAVKASGEAERGALPRRVLLRISDTGIGMSAEEIARSMRDPLAEAATAGPAQAAEANEAEGEDIALRFRRRGAGLGLPVARALAEANSIQFSLSSEPGKGTSATLIFPAAEAKRR